MCAVVFATAAVAGCNTSNNYFYEEKPDNPQEQESVGILGAFLEGTGVVQREQQPIEYKARSPIAIPPTTELPDPEPEGGSAIAAVDWPDDPDKNGKNSAAASAIYSGGVDQERLTPEQIQAGRIAGGLPPSGGSQLKDPSFLDRDTGSKRLTPAEMKQGFESPDKGRAGKVLTAEGQAQPRQYLIQPPDEYRKPADTAPLPSEDDIKNSDWATKQLYGDKSLDKNPVYDNVN
ncbi:hypothetical protein [Amorphus sp. 3PC139-8]|uniref:hypothetical protein n=1 Tax=Amorphus sp. 3PC139-8 TaxID=2735676 RepID=UPI00345CE45F